MEDLGRWDHPFKDYEALLDQLQLYCANCMRVLQIRIDFEAFAQPWAGGVYPPTGVIRRLETTALLERCLLMFKLGWTRKFASAVKPGRIRDQDIHASCPRVQVRFPCFGRDAARETILGGALLDQYCEVGWTESVPVKYGGPAGQRFDSRKSDKASHVLRAVLQDSAAGGAVEAD